MANDNEHWIIEVGDQVINKKAIDGFAGLTREESLVYCLWVADYSMRNAGDLSTASDLYEDFQKEGVRAASELGLNYTRESFALPSTRWKAEYFERFD